MKRCSGNINFTKSDRWPSPSSFRALVFKQQSIISLLTGVTCQFLLLSKSQQFHDRGLFSLPFLSLVMVRAIYACMNAFSFNFTPKLRPKSPLFPSPPATWIHIWVSTTPWRGHGFSLYPVCNASQGHSTSQGHATSQRFCFPWIFLLSWHEFTCLSLWQN